MLRLFARPAPALALGLALGALGGAGLPRAAAACSCADVSPADAVAAAELVAEVEAGISEPVDPKLEAHAATTQMLVIRVFRGQADEGRELPVRAATVSEACGLPFERGRRYLLFAYRDDARVWRTNSCTLTRRTECAERELQRLERDSSTAGVAPSG